MVYLYELVIEILNESWFFYEICINIQFFSWLLILNLKNNCTKILYLMVFTKIYINSKI